MMFFQLSYLCCIFSLLLLTSIFSTTLAAQDSTSSSSTYRIESIQVYGDPGNHVFGIGDLVHLVVEFDQKFVHEDSPLPCSPQLMINVARRNHNKKKFSWATFVNVKDFTRGNTHIVLSDKQLVFRYMIQADDYTTETYLDIGQVWNKTNSWDASNCSNFGIYFDTEKLSSLTITPKVSIDTKKPAILSISTWNDDGEYQLGEVLDIWITFSKKVFVDTRFGTPHLILNSGASVHYFGYANLDDQSTLLFRYTIGEGETSKVLDVMDSKCIQLNGGGINDMMNGISADLSCPFETDYGSLSSFVNISVKLIGQKLPPYGYDKNSAPVLTNNKLVSIPHYSIHENSMSVSDYQLNSTEAVKVFVTLQVNNVYDFSEKYQSFRADIIVVQSWYDPRFDLPDKLAPVTENSSSILNQIWFPRISFVNQCVSKAFAFDSKVLIHNNGIVQIWDRYINTFHATMDVRNFPFDTQTLVISVRSASYDSSIVQFVPMSAIEAQAMNGRLKEINDSAFEYGEYQQEVIQTKTGLLKGFQILKTSFKAKRIATFNSMFVLFPLCMISFMLMISFWLQLKSDSRISVCVGAIGGTLTFSIVLLNISPPVSYMTRMGYFCIQTHVFAFTALCIQIFIRTVFTAVDDLKKNMKNSKKDKDQKKVEEKKVEATGSEEVKEIKDSKLMVPFEYLKLEETFTFAKDVTLQPNYFSHSTSVNSSLESDSENGEESLRAQVEKGMKKETNQFWKLFKYFTPRSNRLFYFVVVTADNCDVWLSRIMLLTAFCRIAYLFVFVVTTSLIIFL